jgi:hypothetical protein
LRHHERWLCQALVVVAAGVCVLAVTACAGSAGGASQTHASQVRQVPSHDEVVLVPRLGAGDGGWCITTIRAASGCPSLGLSVSRGPIIIEHWSGQSTYFGGGRRSSGEGPVREGIVLTTSEVAAVSFEGGAPIATHAESALPDRLRGAILDLRGGSGGQVGGLTVPPPLPRSHFTALNAKGEPIPQLHAPAPPLGFVVPNRSWGRSATQPPGVCGVEVRGLAGLVSEGGGVMTAVRPHPDVRGREFVDCERTTYLLDKWPLEVNVLLDAAHPGSTPARLPALQPLAGHPGLFEGPGLEADTIARRIPGAWLLVAEGEGLQQRLTFLEHLRATVHL